MKYSQKTEYAIHSLLFLALVRKVTLVEEIADKLEVPASYLAKVMQQLTREGLAKSYKGPNGGYMLARTAEEITLGEIVRIFERKEMVMDCFYEDRNCSLWPRCLILEKLDEAFEDMLTELENVTIEDIIESTEKFKELRRDLNIS